MIPLMRVYEAFLAKINDDEWAGEYTQEDLEWFLKDWRSILNSSLIYFTFPRCKLEINEELQCFIDDKMGQDEIEVIANLMKREWLSRTILSWENVKTYYGEADFSQANLLSNFIKLLNTTEDNVRLVLSIYSRSINKKPFNYAKLAGGKSNGRKKR